MADLAALQVSLDLQTAAFERGMAQANASMARMEQNSKKTSNGIQSLANGLKTMAAGVGIAAIASFAKELANAADAAADTADAFGTTTAKIFAYNQAMVEAGGTSDKMNQVMQKLADTVDNAFEGSDTAVEAFKRLGISLDDIKNKQLADILDDVTKALERETDATKRAALAKELLGKGITGVDMATFNKAVAESGGYLEQYNDDLRRAADAADYMAKVWEKTKTQLTIYIGGIIKAVGDLASAFGSIWDVVTGKKSLLEALTFTQVEESAKAAAPAIERVAQATAAQKAAATEAAKANEEWNKQIAKAVETQIAWEGKLLDSINPMREIDRELTNLEKALESGRISWEQYADGMFKIMEAGTKFAEPIKDGLDEIGVAIGNTISNGVGQLVNSFYQAGQSFSEMTAGMLRNIASLITQMLVLAAIKKSLAGTSMGGFLGFAQGGAFSGGTGLPQGIYTQPTFFPMAGTGLMKFAHGGTFGGTGVLGEAGPEAIMPLKRTGSGDLGVQGTPTTINVINNNNSDVQVTENESEQGKQIDIIISQKVKSMFSTGEMDKTMRSNFGARRVGY